MALSKGQRPASKGSLKGSMRGPSTACPFDKLRVTSKGEWTHGLRPAYPNKMNMLIAEARRMAPSLSKGTCVGYFLRLRSGALYIGATEDLEQRLGDHFSGQACRTTQLDPPAFVLRLEFCSSFSEARTREAQLKRWSRGKKEALIEDNFKKLHALSQSRESAKRPNTKN